MSSSTALLPDQKRGDQHPIFLRVCHSPWLFIGQKMLVMIRGVTTTYLLVSFLMVLQYDLRINQHGWLTAFELPNVVYMLQIIYNMLAFIWTTMHLYYPHSSTQTQTNSTRLQKMFSPPRQNPTTKNRTFFSIFYTAAVTYPHVVNFIYWAVLTPMHKTTIPVDKAFSSGSYTRFFILNKYAIGSATALMEVLVNSSIRRPEPVGAHMVGLSTFSLAYVGWTFLGYVVTDKYHYFFFNHKIVGWEHFGLNVVGFIAITNIFFIMVYGVTGIREALTKRGEARKSGGGYTRLPQ
ncbi:hypothetical protein D0Z07_4049 [Hyphodiscus hymeniophilus]|uniref:Uncharacterized protein n=1 Tax=Hyphodiscus hymeniophilus TaxID=353542 RepID=A0A9P7AXH1_9HELO|nr:hypothetical protein D0Z07_4049 [Hyphodiscus hymeniophilus]